MFDTDETTKNPLFTTGALVLAGKTASLSQKSFSSFGIRALMEPLEQNSQLNVDKSPNDDGRLNYDEFDDEGLEAHEEVVLVKSISSSSSLQYCEISKNSLQECSMDNKSLLLHLRSLFPSSSDVAFEQVAPLSCRDLLRMHEAVSKSEEIVLLVRKHCIIFQMDPIKAIILPNRVFIIRMVEADVKQRELETRIVTRVVQAWHSIGNNQLNYQTFEVYMLDTLLNSVMEIINESLSASEIEVRRITKLLGIKYFLPPTTAERVRRVETQVETHQAWLASCRERLDEISEDEEEMALLNLTILEKRRINIDSMPAEEISSLAQPIEDMLELYIVDLNALAGRVNRLLMLLTNAKATMQLRLQTIENELLLANTNFQLLLCCLSVGVYVSGILGMNLNWSLLVKLNFTTVSVVISIFMVLSFVILRYYLNAWGILPVRVSKYSSSTSWQIRIWQWMAS